MWQKLAIAIRKAEQVTAGQYSLEFLCPEIDWSEERGRHKRFQLGMGGIGWPQE